MAAIRHLLVAGARRVRATAVAHQGIVQDGAHEMWNRTREGLQTLRGEGLLERWEEGIDRYHLLERIADAMTLVEPDAEARKRKLDEWREGFDIQPNGARDSRPGVETARTLRRNERGSPPRAAIPRSPSLPRPLRHRLKSSSGSRTPTA